MTRTRTRRSTRRAVAELEGRQVQQAPAQAQSQRRSGRHSAPSPKTGATQHTTRMQDNIAQPRPPARMKRPLDQINSNSDPLKSKRARNKIVIEIQAKSQAVHPPKTVALRTAQRPAAGATTTTTTQQTQQPPHHHNKPPPRPPPPSAAAQPAPAVKTAHSQLTNHQKKVINGIRHELDRLQPSAADAGQAREPGRKLRSQEATRFKSELSAYFPDYDEVIGNDAKEHHVLNIETPILVVDSQASPHYNVRKLPPRHASPLVQPQQLPTGSSGNRSRHDHSHKPIPEVYPVKHFGDILFTNLYEAQRIDFGFLGARHSSDDPQDPLPDSAYEPAHRKAERLEKSIRNTEKGRAQHEKDQIIRLLGELQGPDWLRTMGVSGITESKKKTFEPARDHFIRGCQAILDKFRWWSLEEKKRKLERDRVQAEEAASTGLDDEEDVLEEEEDEEAEDEDGEEEEEEEEEEEGGGEEGGGEEEAEEQTKDEVADSEDEEMLDATSAQDIPDDVSDGDPPDYSDVDASIAKQLHEEALARVRFAPSVSSRRSRGEPAGSPPPPPPKVFKSFFQKQHERDAALNRPRRSRRVAMAWGHHIPETTEEEFELAEEYRDDETMLTRERKKRRERRGSRR
ncbi:uncharacterized protein JN550_003980 [Neoarthrinium moseri]|uniref:uncharacterized protein n=1 Tax=Neoarthrinium moseri TaxID=1658444 RepID=UPI001FDC8534|nr:uncharacterized protein JN550_003980 [Neoarthrinium moseri]KAI1872261.1 hypothetical protein JN550_003980 [Neoarthrinium moseri]